MPEQKNSENVPSENQPQSESTDRPQFLIGNIRIHGDLILAPMDGVTDLPFRGICRRMGSAICVTEFINGIDVVQNNARYHPRLAFRPFHRPLSLQLLDDDPHRLLKVAQQLSAEIHPDIIDINLGCQSKNVTSRGAGAALMLEPQKIAQIFTLLTQHLGIPITGKIRLGWDDKNLNYLEVAKIIEDHGGAMVAVHGRTRQQGYQGQARWEPIAEIKAALSIPVVGNGDVKTTADIQKMKEMTRCDGVMIGRAAVANPWIFNRLSREEVPPPSVRDLILSHLAAMLEFYDQRGLILFRKFLKAYLKPYDIPQKVLLPLLTSRDPEYVHQHIESIFETLS
jgi:nifR3 family TIM-barrel protein